MGDVEREAVRRSWARIIGWLDENAPVTAAALLPPGADAVARVEQHLGLGLPDDLAEYFRLTGGGGPEVDLLMDSQPLPVEACLQRTSETAEIWGEADAPGWETAPAGSGAGHWDGRFLALGDFHTSDLLAVDLRDGPLRGCVFFWSGEEAYIQDPMWPSVAAMLEAIADALETGTAPDGLRPAAVDGTLVWEI